MGAFKHSPGCTCCAPCGSVVVTVTGCCSLVLAGATVTLKLSGSTVGTATTNSSGVATISISAAGSYTVDVACTGFTTQTGVAVAATCTTNNKAITLAVDSAYACVAGCGQSFAKTATFSADDGLGAVTLSYDGTSGTFTQGKWVGCGQRTHNGYPRNPADGSCDTSGGSFTSVSVATEFLLDCNGLRISFQGCVTPGPVSQFMASTCPYSRATGFFGGPGGGLFTPTVKACSPYCACSSIPSTNIAYPSGATLTIKATGATCSCP